MRRIRLLAAAAALSSVSGTVAAQSAGQPVPPIPSGTPLTGDKAAAETRCAAQVPALTPVQITIDADLGSKISTTGEFFPLHLAEPIVIDGRELVPAGVAGQGEVIHAKKAGGGGSAGELVLAARFVTVGSRNMKLRSMRFAVAGADAIHTVDAINAASVASPLPVGLLGFAITGRNVHYPKGTVATAKTAEPFGVSCSNGDDSNGITDKAQAPAAN